MIDRRYLGVLPARAGSKRVPGKNLRPLGGRPLIEWTISAALESQRLDEINVSTDDAEIADVAISCGAIVPFLRPPWLALATDHATTEEVVLDMIRRPVFSERATHVVVLQPTSPFRSAEDFDCAIDLLEKGGGDAVVSVSPAECPPSWVNRLPADRSMHDFFAEETRGLRSQDHDAAYRLNGAIYVYDIQRALDQRTLRMDDATYAYVMPRSRSVDIDEEFDFLVAEGIVRVQGVGP